MSEHTIHTPGRIRYYENGEANSYAMLEESADGRWLLTLLHNGHDVTERQIANMRRLVACWNACEGMTTENLENVTMTGDTLLTRFQLRDKTESELTKQRDELLHVAQRFIGEYEENEEDEWSREWQDLASVFRAAIAKATGDKP